MKQYHDNETIQETLRKAGTIITLFVTIGGVVISLFNYALLNQLQPLNSRISSIEKIQAQDQTDKLLLATKEQVAGISNQLNDLKAQVQLLIEKNLK